MLLGAHAAAQNLPTYAHDGDNIIIAGQDHRLEGIDAFELKQTCKVGDEIHKCAHDARIALQSIIAGRDIKCAAPSKRDRQGRPIVFCTADGIDIEAQLVSIGWAFVRPDFLKKKPERLVALCTIEAEARTKKRGMWAWFDPTRFRMPYEHKRGKQTSEVLKKITCPHWWE